MALITGASGIQGEYAYPQDRANARHRLHIFHVMTLRYWRHNSCLIIVCSLGHGREYLTATCTVPGRCLVKKLDASDDWSKVYAVSRSPLDYESKSKRISKLFWLVHALMSPTLIGARCLAAALSWHVLNGMSILWSPGHFKAIIPGFDRPACSPISFYSTKQQLFWLPLCGMLVT